MRYSTGFGSVIGSGPVGEWETATSSAMSNPNVKIRALTTALGMVRNITTAELGTGLKPVVLVSGQLKLRSTNEGSPVVIVSGQLRTTKPYESIET